MNINDLAKLGARIRLEQLQREMAELRSIVEPRVASQRTTDRRTREFKRRSAAQKERWSKMTARERMALIASMRAGRNGNGASHG